MKVIKYILQNKFLFVICALLLITQTAFAYILPYLQSRVINVGLSQEGIETCVPNKMSKESFDNIVFIEPATFEQLNNSYDISSDDTYELKDISDYEKDQLHNSIYKAFAFVYNSTQNNINLDQNNYASFLDSNEDGFVKQISLDACKQEMKKYDFDVFENQINYIFRQGLLMMMLVFVFAIASYLQTIVNARIALLISYEKKKSLYNKIIKFSNKEINKFGKISLLTRMTNDIKNVENFIFMVLSTLFNAPINIAIGFIFATITAPTLSWILIVAALAVFLASVISVKIFAPVFRKVQLLIENLNMISHEIISGIFTTRTLNNTEHEKKRFNNANSSLFDVQYYIGKIYAMVNPVLMLGMNFVTIIILLLGGLNINIGLLQAGDIVAFISYTSMVVGAFSALGMLIGSLPRATIAVNRIDEVLKEEISIKTTDTDAHHKLDFNYKIVFEDVSYSYNNNNNYQINDINIEIYKGQTLGIVGEIGSGKSTLVKLLLRLDDVSKGQIFVDGKKIQSIPVELYRSMFAYCPQDSFLFSGNIKSNITYGLDSDAQDFSSDDLYQIIKDVHLDELTEKEKMFDYPISQDSVNISGGQKQRLSIARALASNREIFVFDDTFTSLDYKVEKDIIDKIFNKYKNKTKVIVSSRLSSLKYADKILCMDKGRVVGFGSFDQLEKTCPEFVKIVKSQLETL